MLLDHTPFSRRQFLGACAFGAGMVASRGMAALVDPAVQILMPRDRVPLSFIIDDSTCLVNMGHYAYPQFATAWPDRAEYKKDWTKWPREIPDSFVREFGEWCAEQGVKGKYSIVPNPACVGWLDRELPGWSHRQLEESLKLVRELMVPNWDIHPEMITHTRVIDLKTGRPFADINAGTMENSYPQEDKSVDELANYLAYALRILKNCELPCEGITTPGGFGNRVKTKLPQAVFEAVRDVYGTDLPHFFKYVSNGDESTEPTLERWKHDSSELQLTVNVPAGTGDWFGSWHGDAESQPDLYCTEDATSGRMVELIEQRRPALMLCHWPGMYCHGSKTGFHAFQRVVLSLAARFKEETYWMKVSDIGRYWAAKELTKITSPTPGDFQFDTPFGSADFTVEFDQRLNQPVHVVGDKTTALEQVNRKQDLVSGSFLRTDSSTIVCFDLPKGNSILRGVTQ
ncbi:MAG: hypothetical protein R3C18_01285 [Planctomycetaceae bacterium]